jgi:uncharacterized phage protein (TIGR02216 family)
MMAFGFGVLRLDPVAFWGLTIPEFKAAVRGRQGGSGGVEPLPRAAFSALMRQFPDVGAARNHDFPG